MLQQYLVYTLLIYYMLSILKKWSILYYPYMLSICIAYTSTNRPFNRYLVVIYMHILGICIAYVSHI